MMRRRGRWVGFVAALFAAVAHAQYTPPPDSTVAATTVLRLPRIGRFVDPTPRWEELAQRLEKTRTQTGSFAVRPGASGVNPSALYVVSDCTSNACTAGGGSTACTTQSDGTSVWTVLQCGGTGGSGANPGGAATELQYRSGSNSFGAVAGSTWTSGTSTLAFTSALDLSGGKLRLPYTTTCAPTDCDAVGEYGRVCFDSDAPTGRHLYACEASGWILAGDGGGANLDFDAFKDAMALDASLTIAQSTATWTQTFTGTGGPAVLWHADNVANTPGFMFTGDAVTNGSVLTVSHNPTDTASGLGGADVKVEQIVTGISAATLPALFSAWREFHQSSGSSTLTASLMYLTSAVTGAVTVAAPILELDQVGASTAPVLLIGGTGAPNTTPRLGMTSANGGKTMFRTGTQSADITYEWPTTLPAADSCWHMNAAGTITFASCSGASGSSFTTIATPNASNPLATGAADTLTLTAGAGMTITGTSGTDTVDFKVNVPTSTCTGTDKITWNGTQFVCAVDQLGASGSGTVLTVNGGASMSTADLNSTTPSEPAGTVLNNLWAVSGSSVVSRGYWLKSATTAPAGCGAGNEGRVWVNTTTGNIDAGTALSVCNGSGGLWKPQGGSGSGSGAAIKVENTTIVGTTANFNAITSNPVNPSHVADPAYMNVTWQADSATPTTGIIASVPWSGSGTALNASLCSADAHKGRLFILTSAPPGQQVFVCEGAVSGWTLQGHQNDPLGSCIGDQVTDLCGTVNFYGQAFDLTGAGKIIYRDTFSYVLYRPGGLIASDTINAIYAEMARPFNVEKVCCESDAGTVTVNLRRATPTGSGHTNPTNVLTTPVTCAVASGSGPMVPTGSPGLGCSVSLTTGQSAFALGDAMDLITATGVGTSKISVMVKRLWQ